jgi:hypothetical protein
VSFAYRLHCYRCGGDLDVEPIHEGKQQVPIAWLCRSHTRPTPERATDCGKTKLRNLIRRKAITADSRAAARATLDAAPDGRPPRRLHEPDAPQSLARGSLAALQHASSVTTQRYARLTDEAVMREAARLAR